MQVQARFELLELNRCAHVLRMLCYVDQLSMVSLESRLGIFGSQHGM